MADDFKIDIIIITYNACDLTLDCIQSILDTASHINMTITVVDNNSTDDTVKRVEEIYPNVNLIKNERNMGYAAASNVGIKATNSEIIVLANSDVIFHPDSIEMLTKYMVDNPKAGVSGPQQQYTSGKWQRSFGDLPSISTGLKNLFFITTFRLILRKILWKKINVDKRPKRVQYLDGAVNCIRREAIDQIGGFDEDYFFYTEEADLCHRLKKAGWEIVFLPIAHITHVRGGSTTVAGISQKMADYLIGSKLLYCKKHLTKFQTKVYARLELLHYISHLVGWHIVRLLTVGSRRKKCKAKAGNLSKLSLSWKNVFKKFVTNEDYKVYY